MASTPWVMALADFADHVAPRGIKYRRLSDLASLSGSVEVDHVLVKKGDRITKHRHAHSSALCFIIKGAGSIVLGARAYPIAAGNVVNIPAGIDHAFHAGDADLVFLSVQHPPIADDYVFPEDL